MKQGRILRRAGHWLAVCILAGGCGSGESSHPSTSDADASAEPAVLDAAGGKTDAGAAHSSDARVIAAADAARAQADAAGAQADAARDRADASVANLTDGGVVARPGWKLIFSDEFDGPSGALPDANHWVFETGGGGFGNSELEFYTARAENAALDGQGKLVITARAESYMGSKYTSARLKTQGKFEHGYGRYEARLRIPKGQGIWPAFWMLGADIGKNTWPACGEIDIMENIGKEPTLIHGTVHGPGYSGGNGIGKSYELPTKAVFSDDFHLFAIEWETNVLRWYVDDVLYQTRTPADLPASAKWVYEHDFFILLNLAVGGQWPGNPDGSTVFPQTLSVDYVRVYDRAP